jgi:hypothetical protein
MEDSIDDKLEKYVIEKTYKLLSGNKAKLGDSMFQYSPSSYFPQLSDEDYERGMFFRYFARRTNNINATAIEISKDEYFEKSNPSPFYTCTYIAWKIKGPMYDEYDADGILQFSGVIPHNQRQIELAKSGFKLEISIKNPLEFYKKD